MHMMIEPTAAPRAQFAAILQKARVQRMYSVREVADRCGVRQEVVIDWEAGSDVPHGREWARLKGLLSSLQAAALVWRAALESAAENESGRGEDAGDAAEMADLGDEPGDAEVNGHGQGELPEKSRSETRFGSALRIARSNDRVTQQQVAELVGVTTATMSAWETGRCMPVHEHWLRLVDLFPVLRECVQPDPRRLRKPVGNRVPQARSSPADAARAPSLAQATGQNDVALAGTAYAHALHGERRAAEDLRRAQDALATATSIYERAKEAASAAHARLIAAIGEEQ